MDTLHGLVVVATVLFWLTLTRREFSNHLPIAPAMRWFRDRYNFWY